jgi:hypothetical protein
VSELEVQWQEHDLGGYPTIVLMGEQQTDFGLEESLIGTTSFVRRNSDFSPLPTMCTTFTTCTGQQLVWQRAGPLATSWRARPELINKPVVSYVLVSVAQVTTLTD